MKDIVKAAIELVKDTARCEALYKLMIRIKKSNKKKFSREELIDMISDEILED